MAIPLSVSPCASCGGAPSPSSHHSTVSSSSDSPAQIRTRRPVFHSRRLVLAARGCLNAEGGIIALSTSRSSRVPKNVSRSNCPGSSRSPSHGCPT